jgi:ribonucleoside-diphosphate reductase beta chain
MTNILAERTYYKPFNYPWAYGAWKEQQIAHWNVSEISFDQDVNDWVSKLTDNEKEFLTHIFRFFTQADIDVAGGYVNKFLPVFKQPEVRMMLATFSSMETVHIDAYSKLIDTVGMPDTEYSKFMTYSEMADKHDYIMNQKDIVNNGIVDVEELAKQIAIFSAFTEGLQLFSSFVMLMNFPRYGKMNGMGQVITWSIRDETIHFTNMIKLFRVIISENPHIWTDAFKKELYDVARKMVELEDKFIDLSFSTGGITGLTAGEVKEYIRYIADRRLLQLGLKPNFGISKHHLNWYDEMMNTVEHVNFFENRVTEYSKGTLTGDWSY